MKTRTQVCTGFKTLAVLCALAAASLWTSTVLAQTSVGGANLEEIISGIEKRYSGAGFSARFEQRSIMKAMDITDTASGTIVVKRPGKMRWTYESPEKQVIITDGTNLWIYKPEDNQVAVGRAPAFFAGGKGAGFLSDMKQLREKFDIHLESGDIGGPYVLNLKPVGANLDIAAIYLTVSTGNFEITRIVTYNAYGDENRIDLKDIVYKDAIDDELFTFQIPKGADILQLEEEP
jgi:outer membrane lipoprotein carrier protein